MDPRQNSVEYGINRQSIIHGQSRRTRAKMQGGESATKGVVQLGFRLFRQDDDDLMVGLTI